MLKILKIANIKTCFLKLLFKNIKKCFLRLCLIRINSDDFFNWLHHEILLNFELSFELFMWFVA